MTLADLAVTIKQRALARARDQVVSAWRTAYYHRVKHMPDLEGELAELKPGGDDREVDARGYMTEERAARVWGKIKAGVMAWNVRLASEGAA